MKRLTQFLARLYPARWRERYGQEFDALLEDTNPSPRAALNVLAGAVTAQLRTARKIAYIAVCAVALVSVAAWFAARHPYISPGNNLVLRQDSDLGAIVTMLVVLATLILLLVSFSMLLCGKWRPAKRIFLANIAGLAIYSSAVILVSVLSPRTIVSVGDGYCYDLLCIGVQHVDVVPQGQNVVYTAHVRLFSDADRVKTSAKGASLYLVDERGRRFPPVVDPAEDPLDATLGPGESVTRQLTFVAAADARQLFLTKDSGILPPWVFLYLGSDISPFHRRTLLRVL